MATKHYRVEYYQGYVVSDNGNQLVSEILRDIAESGPRALHIGRYGFRINSLQMVGNAQSFSGVFAKYRGEVLPHVGAPDGEEREIDLAEDEGIIEKNHFLYYSRRQVLVYQANHHASRASTLARYLTTLASATVSFGPVIQPEALDRLVAGNARTRSIEISYAKPSDSVVRRAGHELSQELLDLLNSAGGARARVKISPKRRGYLNLDIRGALSQLMSDLDVRKAKVKMEEQDGVEHFVDLIAERLVGEETVTMDGRYPVTEEMFSALRRNYDQHRETLRAILHDAGNDED